MGLSPNYGAASLLFALAYFVTWLTMGQSPYYELSYYGAVKCYGVTGP